MLARLQVLVYVQQRKEKEELLATKTANVAALVESLEAIGDRNLEMLRADFAAESQAGTVTPMIDDLVVQDTPEDCQQSVKDARQKVIDTLLEVNIQMTFQGWLREQLDADCTDRAAEIQ